MKRYTFVVIITLISCSIILSGCISNNDGENTYPENYSSSDAIEFIMEYLAYNYDLHDIKVKSLHTVNTTNGDAYHWDCSIFVLLNDSNETYVCRFPFMISYLNYSFDDSYMWDFLKEHYITLEKVDVEKNPFENEIVYIDSTVAVPMIMDYYYSHTLIKEQESIYWKGIYFEDGEWMIVYRGDNSTDHIEIRITYYIEQNQFNLQKENIPLNEFNTR